MKPMGVPMKMINARQTSEGKTQAAPKPKNGTVDDTKLRMYGGGGYGGK